MVAPDQNERRGLPYWFPRIGPTAKRWSCGRTYGDGSHCVDGDGDGACGLTKDKSKQEGRKEVISCAFCWVLRVWWTEVVKWRVAARRVEIFDKMCGLGCQIFRAPAGRHKRGAWRAGARGSTSAISGSFGPSRSSGWHLHLPCRSHQTPTSHIPSGPVLGVETDEDFDWYPEASSEHSSFSRDNAA